VSFFAAPTLLTRLVAHPQIKSARLDVIRTIFYGGAPMYVEDRPAAVWSRYKGVRPTARSAFWWLHAQISSFPSGRSPVIALTQRGVVRYGIDGSRVIGQPKTPVLVSCRPASIPPRLNRISRLEFTIRWDTGEWIGQDFFVHAEP
jgi:glucoamylase